MIIQPVNGGSAAAFIRRLNDRNEYMRQLEILDSIIYVLAGPTATPTISPTTGEQNLRTSNIEQDDPEEESPQINSRNNPHLDLIEKVGSKQILPVNNSEQKGLFPTSAPTVSLSLPTIPATTNTVANKISSKEKMKVEGAAVIAIISGCGLIGCAILLGFYCYQLRKVQQEQQHKSTY